MVAVTFLHVNLALHSKQAWLVQLAAAAFPMLMRFGSGGFGSGYSAKLDSDDGKYGAVRIAGRKVSNTPVAANNRHNLQQR